MFRGSLRFITYYANTENKMIILHAVLYLWVIGRVHSSFDFKIDTIYSSKLESYPNSGYQRFFFSLVRLDASVSGRIETRKPRMLSVWHPA